LITPLRLTGYAEHTPADWVRTRLQFSYTPGFDRFPGSTNFGEGEVDGVFLVDALASFDVGPGELNVGIENLLDNQFVPVRRQAINTANIFFAAPGLTVAVSYQLTW
jgi:iron complex outermembrane receptor protein